MISKKFKQLCISAAVLVLFATTLNAQQSFSEVPTMRAVWVKSVQAGNVNAGYWDLPGKMKRGEFKKGANVGVWQSDGGEDQQFVFVKRENDTYSIQSFNGFGTVDIAGGNNADGVNIQMWEGNSSPAQRFRFKYLGDGRWKIYTLAGRAICLAGRNHGNGSNVHIWGDHDGPWMEWYFIDVNNSQKLEPVGYSQPVEKKESTRITMKQATGNDTLYRDQYFKLVDNEKFNSENSNGELKVHLNGLETGKQWNAVIGIINNAKQNSDIAAKRSILKAVSEVIIKPASGFAENLLKGPVTKKINDEAASEKDAESKNYIKTVAGKF